MSSFNSKSDNEETNNMEIQESYDDIKSWDELEIKSNLLRGIFAHGFEKPSPIQEKAIVPIIKGRDIIAQAQSGTGKTAAFSIGALELVDLSIAKTQVLVLSPTRELTIQTSKVMQGIGAMMEGLIVKTSFGGSPFEDNSSSIPHVICGCTGRVYDMIQRNKIDSSGIKLVILDEADEMLSSGFKEQVYNIFQNLDNNIQIALFSATLPAHIYQIINKIMRNPVKITVQSDMLTLEGISQFHVSLQDDKHKYITLKHLFSFISLSQCIIYCNSIKRVIDLYEAMVEDEFPVTIVIWIKRVEMKPF
jgi:translation initiation factor 4A